MDNLDQIIEAMPKVSHREPVASAGDANPPRPTVVLKGVTIEQVNLIVAYQCRLLAKEGYRKVPSEEEIYRKLYGSRRTLDGVGFAVIFHNWLMGEQKEER